MVKSSTGSIRTVMSRKRSDSLESGLSDLHDRRVSKRLKAAERLGDVLRGKKAPRALISALRDPNELVRVEAAQSLASISDRKVLPALWRALKDTSPLVRSYVAAAIGVLGDDTAAAKLQRVAAAESSDVARIGVYTGLWSLGDLSALGEILKLLSSEVHQVRCAAASTLAKIADGVNRRVIMAALQRGLDLERTAAARNELQKSLRALRERFRPTARIRDR